MATKLTLKTGLALCCAGALGASLVGACGANDGNPRGQSGGAGGSAASGASGGSAGSLPDGSAGSSSGGTGATGFEGGLDVAPLDDSGLNDANACTSTGAEATLIPVNVYLMVDISGSMSSLLSTVKLGLAQFLADPQTAGTRVCINYFPKDSASTCDPLLFYTPEVPLGELTADPAPTDAQEYALVNSINSKSVLGATPMYGALRGALDFSKDHVKNAPGEKMVVILTTDGSPNSCLTAPDDQNSIDFIAGLAAHYWNAYGVATYSIGFTGSQEAEVTKIAVNAGGKAFFLGGSSNVAQDLIAALKAISGSLIACEYAIPEKTEAGVVDPSKVNVEFKDGSGTKKSFFKVDGPGNCVPDGWYYVYDASNTPISIKLCPAACDEVQNDGQSKITILLGCASVPPP